MFISQGDLHIIPFPSTPANTDLPTTKPTLQQASKLVLGDEHNTCGSDQIQNCIKKRIEGLVLITIRFVLLNKMSFQNYVFCFWIKTLHECFLFYFLLVLPYFFILQAVIGKVLEIQKTADRNIWTHSSAEFAIVLAVTTSSVFSQPKKYNFIKNSRIWARKWVFL